MSEGLGKFSLEFLEKEVRDRKKKLREVPPIIEEPDFSNLREVVSSVMRNHSNGNDYDYSDITEKVCEATLVAFYGKFVWDWWAKVDA